MYFHLQVKTLTPTPKYRLQELGNPFVDVEDEVEDLVGLAVTPPPPNIIER